MIFEFFFYFKKLKYFDIFEKNLSQEFKFKIKNMKKFISLFILLAFFFSESYAQEKLTPELLWKLRRLGSFVISPNQKDVLFSVKDYKVEENKGKSTWYIQNLETNKTITLPEVEGGQYSCVWIDKANKIAFLSKKSGIMQIWEMDKNGKNLTQISDEKEGIQSFSYSPNEKHILFVKRVKMEKTVQDIYPDLPHAEARIIDHLMYRHWDSWSDYSYNHIFVATYKNGKISNAIDILKDEPYDSPMMPFGGLEEIAWSKDSKQIAYTCKKEKGKKYAMSTNSEIYLYDLASKKTSNLSKGIMGYDKNPVFSPDGKKLLWSSMERNGFEADKERIMIYDLQTKKREDISKKFDQNAGSIIWSKDSKNLFFITGVQATYQIFSYNFDKKSFRQITNGVHNYRSFDLIDEKTLIGTKQSMSMPTEMFTINIADGKEKQITFLNKSILDKIKMGKVEKRWVKTTDGKDMLTWVIFPPNFDKNKKYPTLLYAQGGPQSAVSQFFSYRWNFQLMAANDYIIVAPNRRGLPTFGQEWNDQISKDYGGQNMKDYFSAIDELKKEPYINENKMGAIGASYGGFSVYWLAGNHEKRFKTFISHCGIFNFEAMYGATEELFFVDWDLGGSYWNKQKKNSYDASPHKFVNNWDTPILVVHGQKDFRIPVTQGMNAFTVAQLKNIPSRFLYFPKEGHWVLSPQNGILWHRVFFDWLERDLK